MLAIKRMRPSHIYLFLKHYTIIYLAFQSFGFERFYVLLTFAYIPLYYTLFPATV
jgi:hypothetical protein